MERLKQAEVIRSQKSSKKATNEKKNGVATPKDANSENELAIEVPQSTLDSDEYDENVSDENSFTPNNKYLLLEEDAGEKTEINDFELVQSQSSSLRQICFLYRQS